MLKKLNVLFLFIGIFGLIDTLTYGQRERIELQELGCVIESVKIEHSIVGDRICVRRSHQPSDTVEKIVALPHVVAIEFVGHEFDDSYIDKFITKKHQLEKRFKRILMSNLQLIVFDSTSVSEKGIAQTVQSFPGIRIFLSERSLIHSLTERKVKIHTEPLQAKRLDGLVAEKHLAFASKLEVDAANITKEMMEQLKAFRRVNSLLLRGKQIKDKTLACISNCPTRYLYLEDTAVKGKGLNFVNGNLFYFQLIGANPDFVDFVALSRFKNLSYLYLDSSSFRDDDFENLTKLEKLELLSVVNTRITLNGLKQNKDLIRRLKCLELSDIFDTDEFKTFIETNKIEIRINFVKSRSVNIRSDEGKTNPRLP